MPVELYESQIPGLITWFNNFIGFRELQKRIDRIEMKIKEVGVNAPILDRRFAFQIGYNKLIRRNRLHLAIDIRDVQTNRIISSVGALKLATSKLSERGINRLKSRVRDALSPDRDWREFEHELRVLVHYLAAGCDVEIMDDDENRFDFLVSRGDFSFEVECKTFNESLGYQVSVDQSFLFFSALREALAENPYFLESGILTATTAKRHDWNKREILQILNEFIASSPSSSEYKNIQLEFERKDRWAILAREKRREELVDEMYEHFDAKNPHAMFALQPDRALMFCVTCKERPRILAGMLSRLKSASGQFSKTRPSVIWAHFLGIPGTNFSELIQSSRRGDATPFDVFGQYIFKSEERRHVCRLRLSADTEDIRDHPPSGIILPRRSRGFSTGGPAYDLTSARSIFDAQRTNI